MSTPLAGDLTQAAYVPPGDGRPLAVEHPRTDSLSPEGALGPPGGVPSAPLVQILDELVMAGEPRKPPCELLPVAPVPGLAVTFHIIGHEWELAVDSSRPDGVAQMLGVLTGDLPVRIEGHVREQLVLRVLLLQQGMKTGLREPSEPDVARGGDPPVDEGPRQFDQPLHLRQLDDPVRTVDDFLEGLTPKADQPVHEILEPVGRPEAGDVIAHRVHIPGTGPVSVNREPGVVVHDLFGRQP